MSLDLANSWEPPIFLTPKFSWALWPQKAVILTIPAVLQMCLPRWILTTAKGELSKRASALLLKKASFVQNWSLLLTKMLDFLMLLFLVWDIFQVKVLQRNFFFNNFSISVIFTEKGKRFGFIEKCFTFSWTRACVYWRRTLQK